MKTKSYFFLTLFFFLLINSNVQSQVLFRIRENGLWGFIDIAGKTVIEPVYKAAGEFSEGLAPVRENGYYGYINRSGNYILPPVYDFAEPFKDGLAKVYINGKANIINKAGNLLISFKCSEISQFKNGMAIVYTKYERGNRKAGVINSRGNLIVDTIYSEISLSKDGVFVVQQPRHQYGVIDSTGKIIVPLGKYERINDLINGFAKVSWYINNNKSGDNWSVGFINTKGELVFSKEHALGFETSKFVSPDSLFMVSEHKYEIENNVGMIGELIFSGLMNLRGQRVKEDTIGIFDFINENIYIKDSINRYSLTDKNGNPLINKTFFKIRGNNYINSQFSFTQLNNKWGIVDTSGRFVVPPEFDYKHYTGIMDDYFFFGMNEKDKHGDIVKKWGVCNIDGKIIIAPEFDDFDQDGFSNGLLKVIVHKNYAYVNKTGKFIWHGNTDDKENLFTLNIDHRLQTAYMKNSAKINKDLKCPEGSISMRVAEDEKYPFNKKYNGISLYITNTSGDSVTMPTVDGALYLVWEAKDLNGQWKSIENFPNSSCGMSYVNTSLNDGCYFKFVIPAYEGGFKTKLRMSLIIGNEFGGRGTRIYSNEIDGSINPAQFWRTRPGFGDLEPFEKYEY